MVYVTPIGSEHAEPIQKEKLDLILLFINFHNVEGPEEATYHRKSRVHDRKAKGEERYQNGESCGPF
jgi:hypothetical protein